MEVEVEHGSGTWKWNMEVEVSLTMEVEHGRLDHEINPVMTQQLGGERYVAM